MYTLLCDDIVESYDVIVGTYFPELSQARAVGNGMYYVPIYNVSGKVSGWLALSILRHQCKYRISANSFRGNYSFLNLALCTVTFGHST